MADEIKAGDTVQLKSGSPDMTVDRLYKGADGVQRASCQWFDGKSEKTANFAVTSLKKV